MRCEKCGYDGAGNVPNGTCIKCGTRLNYSGNPMPIGESALRHGEGGDLQSRPTMIGANLPDMDVKATRIGFAADQQAKNPLKKTVIQSGSFSGDLSVKKTIVQGAAPLPPEPGVASEVKKEPTDLSCPKCGYPLAGNYSSCPNCGFDFDAPIEEEEKLESPSENNKKTLDDKKVSQGTVGVTALNKNDDDELLCLCEKCGAEISATFSFCPKCGAKVHQRTLKGLRHHKKQVEEKNEEATPLPPAKMLFNLTIVPEEDEEITPQATHFEGPENVLNRSNTEPDNRTITSKEQAVISFDNGKWFIENRSEFQSTVIIANRRMEIQTGDIIMLGDRRFKFEVEEPEQE